MVFENLSQIGFSHLNLIHKSYGIRFNQLGLLPGFAHQKRANLLEVTAIDLSTSVQHTSLLILFIGSFFIKKIMYVFSDWLVHLQ